MKIGKMAEKCTAIIVCRMSSTRFPGKILKKICGQTVLEIIVERLSASNRVDEVIVATSTLKADDEIESLCETLGLACFRGSPEDVLDRLYNASKLAKNNLILEVGGDCPLVDAELIEEGFAHFVEGGTDFLSNAFTEPFTYPVGYDFILISKTALYACQKAATLKTDRHQPFQYLISNQDQFNIKSFSSSENLNHWRWTLDYPADLEFLRYLLEVLAEGDTEIGFSSLVSLVKENPEVNELNAEFAWSVSGETIWYTGSFVSEATADIKSLADSALEDEEKENWQDSLQKYECIQELVRNLVERAKTRLSSKC